MSKKKHIAMISGGRDSSAMVIYMLENGMELDHIIFTDTLHEFPFMYDYIKKFNKFLNKTYGKHIEILTPKDSFKHWVFGKVTRGERKGMIRGLPMITVVCFWKRQSKVRPFEKFLKDNNIVDYVQYIGYTYSELKRAKVNDMSQQFPLIDAKICEADVDRILDRVGMVNPLYEHFSRTGCSMCPYQSEKSLYTLWKNYPKEWKYMKKIEKKLSKLDNVVNRTWKIDKRLKEYEKSFVINAKGLSDVPDKSCECAI